jgi:hypothetical protein
MLQVKVQLHGCRACNYDVCAACVLHRRVADDDDDDAGNGDGIEGGAANMISPAPPAHSPENGSAGIHLGMRHLHQLCVQYEEAVHQVEQLLHAQLVAAIGKEVQPVDFAEYMTFHNRKLFKAAYQPRGFCYAIRKGSENPQGTLTIEAICTAGSSVQTGDDIASSADAELADLLDFANSGGSPNPVGSTWTMKERMKELMDLEGGSNGGVNTPISTIVSSTVATAPMRFALDAASEVSFMGSRQIHATIQHQWRNTLATPYSAHPLQLVARARQFSAFILLVGTLPAYGVQRWHTSHMHIN